METLLSAVDLHKRYVLPHKTVQVLQGTSFAVAAGERVAIIGRSGTGKSTLLHLLGGLDRPDQGEILMEGRPLYALRARARSLLRARRIGFVFQSYHLLPEMDVVENVLLPALALGTPHPHAARRARELVALVGLADRMTHTPLELSGGEQQRVALARALMNEPSLLLADEPTGNLDHDTGAQILELLFGLSRDHRHALVIVTHDPQVAARCDRILRLEGGQLLADSGQQFSLWKENGGAGGPALPRTHGNIAN
jgi:predicted ABC-type transport system involved in lysophospholipase L1 biosynthesis ATPase subunit